MPVATELSIRELPQDEWERLAEIEPFATYGIPSGANAEAWKIIVAEVAGEVVGFTGLFNAVHWEPWWIDPNYRQHPGLVRGLIRAGLEMLEDSEVSSVFATVGDEAIAGLVERLGFIPAPGRLYLLYVPDITIR